MNGWSGEHSTGEVTYSVQRRGEAGSGDVLSGLSVRAHCLCWDGEMIDLTSQWCGLIYSWLESKNWMSPFCFNLSSLAPERLVCLPVCFTWFLPACSSGRMSQEWIFNEVHVLYLCFIKAGRLVSYIAISVPHWSGMECYQCKLVWNVCLIFFFCFAVTVMNHKMADILM